MTEQKYRVRGTIELNFDVTVSAENAEEAEQSAIDMANDGRGHDIPTGRTEVTEVVEVLP
jgi:hypothetical protein